MFGQNKQKPWSLPKEFAESLINDVFSSFLLQGNDVAKTSHYSTSKGSKKLFFANTKKQTDYTMTLIKCHSSLVCHKPTTVNNCSTWRIRSQMIDGCNWNQLWALVVSITGGLGDSTTLSHKDCENLWDLLDLCLTCGNPVILPTTFPQNNGWRLWRLSPRKILLKNPLVHNILRHQESTAKGPTN